MFINPLRVSFELDLIGGPLNFCGEMVGGRLNRLNVGIAHPIESGEAQVKLFRPL
jgi:hypothetical protein